MLPYIGSSPADTLPKIIIDTNVLLTSISLRSRHHPIYRSFLNGQYILCITTSIIAEYEEVLGKPEHLGPNITQFVMETIENAANVAFITPHYFWNLIGVDPDDNKFVDCAFACNADYLVTNDSHFTTLKTHPFPQVHVVSADEFLALLPVRQ